MNKKMLDIVSLNKLAIIISVMIIFLIFVMYNKKFKRYNELMSQIPGPVAKYPFIGNLDLYMRAKPVLGVNRYWNVIGKLAEKYREEGIFKITLLNTQLIIIFRKDYFEEILKSNINIDKPEIYEKVIGDWMGKGLVLNDNILSWRQRRKLLTPAFHFRVFNNFEPNINAKAHMLIRKLDKLTNNKIIDMCPLITQCTFDVMSEIILGIQMNTQTDENLEILKAFERMNKTPIERSVQPWLLLRFIFYRTELGRIWLNDLKLLQSFSRRLISERKQIRILERKRVNNNISVCKQSSILDILLDIHLSDKSFSTENIREEVDSFLFAGHDSTATSLSWTLYLLGVNPDIQDKLYDEISSIVTKDEDITTDHIIRMTYLEAVLMESMRVLPPVHTLARKITQEIKLGNYNIPIGANVHLSIFNLNLDANVFPEPLNFNPDRFLKNSNQAENPFSFVPFSAGPRNCIGKKLAINVMKIILAKLLLKLKFKSVDKREDVTIVYGIVTKPLNGIKIIISPRL